MAEEKEELRLWVATEKDGSDSPGAVAHYARSRYADTLCGWSMLYSSGLAREAQPLDGKAMPCWRCEERYREMQP